jgi:hypothetical protein
MNQRRMNRCITHDAITGTPLRRHRHYLQVASIHLADYGAMLFPAFLLTALPDCIPGDNKTLTTADAGVFEPEAPWYSILSREIYRLGLVDVAREIHYMSPMQREEYALVMFSRLAITPSARLPSDLTQWQANHPHLTALTEEYLFFAFYNQWPDCP